MRSVDFCPYCGRDSRWLTRAAREYGGAYHCAGCFAVFMLQIVEKNAPQTTGDTCPRIGLDDGPDTDEDA